MYYNSINNSCDINLFANFVSSGTIIGLQRTNNETMENGKFFVVPIFSVVWNIDANDMDNKLSDKVCGKIFQREKIL